jgi:hypothetical protein
MIEYIVHIIKLKYFNKENIILITMAYSLF